MRSLLRLIHISSLANLYEVCLVGKCFHKVVSAFVVNREPVYAIHIHSRETALMRLTFLPSCVSGRNVCFWSHVISSSDHLSRQYRGVSVQNGHSAIAEVADLISSLPRPLWRRKPIALLELGPRDCRRGAPCSAPMLTVRLLPMGAVAWYAGWSSQVEVLLKKLLRCLLGLV